jgi:hypothetical protein
MLINSFKSSLAEQTLLWDRLLHFIHAGFTSVYTATSREHRESLLFSVSHFIYRLIIFPFRLLLRRGKKSRQELAASDIWLVQGSINNRKALEPLLGSCNSTFICPNEDIVFRKITIYKIIWLVPLALWLSYKKRIKYFILFYDIIGLYEESIRLLTKYKPKILVFANDHAPIQVALKIAANMLGIHTYYFQHGAITNAFPPLEFSVSFLDGQDALAKYRNIGEIKGKVELIGSLKSRDRGLISNGSKAVKTIGIAINRNNNIRDLLKLTKEIIDEFPEIKIRLRNHPADSRIISVINKNTTISDPKVETTFQYLSTVDLLIAGNTNTHLEAVLMNIPSIYYKISSHNLWDSQGFVKNGLIDAAESVKELLTILKRECEKKSDVIIRAAYYDEFINSNCDYENILAEYGLKVRPNYRQLGQTK